VYITAGGDLLGLCDQNSSYKHLSNINTCPILNGYGVTGIFSFSYMPLCEPGDVLNLVAYRSRCKHYLPPDSPTQLQTVWFPYLNTCKVFKECGEGGVGGYSPGQCIQHDSANTTRSKTLVIYITVTVPAPDVQKSMAIVS